MNFINFSLKFISFVRECGQNIFGTVSNPRGPQQAINLVIVVRNL